MKRGRANDDKEYEEPTAAPNPAAKDTKGDRFVWNDERRLHLVELLQEFYPESAPWGQGGQRWEEVHAGFRGLTGLNPALSTLKNQLAALRKELKDRDNIDGKSGQDQEISEALEKLCDYDAEVARREKMSNEEKAKVEKDADMAEKIRQDSLLSLAEKQFDSAAQAELDATEEKLLHESDKIEKYGPERSNKKARFDRASKRFDDPFKSLSDAVKSDSELRARELEIERLRFESAREQREFDHHRLQQEHEDRMAQNQQMQTMLLSQMEMMRVFFAGAVAGGQAGRVPFSAPASPHRASPGSPLRVHTHQPQQPPHHSLRQPST